MHGLFVKFQRRFSLREAPDPFAKVQLALIILMQLAFVGAAGIALYERMWTVLFVSVGAMVAIWLPLILARTYHVRVPLEFEFLLTLFIYGAIFLGEISGFYTRFWWWDIVLHAGSGIALGFVGFLILYSLYRGGKLAMSPSLLALFSFCFAMALGALWEVVEFALDTLLDLTMQKGITDTMWDLIVDALGAAVAAVSGYVYVRFKRHGFGIFEHYLRAYYSDNVA